MYGYAGDGEIHPSDAFELGDLIGVSDPVDDFGLIRIDLDGDFIESLLGDTDYLGLVAYGDDNGHSIDFRATENPYGGPSLFISYNIPGTFPVGDLNLSGRVDDDDLSLLLANWGAGRTWDTGDLDETRTVNDDDLSLLLANWGASYSPAPGDQAVPEPATLSLLTLGALALMRRRRS